MMSYPNPDIEKETVFPPCHCEPEVRPARRRAGSARRGSESCETQAWQSRSIHSGQDFVSLAMTIP